MDITKKMDRNYSLDMVKIVATICIVFHHYHGFSGVVFSNLNFDNGRYYFGWNVELFFMISGFLMYKYIDGEYSFREFL